jgi:hypothetical protein
MAYRMLADLLAVVHLAFVVFVVAGGFLALARPRVAFLHLPAAVWGVLIEWAGWICPLTPLEVRFRRLGGEAGYSGGFVDHYLLPVLYPTGLTESHQLWLGGFVLVLNLGVYGWLVWRWGRERRDGAGPRGHGTQSARSGPGWRDTQVRRGRRASPGSGSQG